MHWYEKNVMGTGPFIFVEHVKGSHWVGKKNPNYWDKGKPYLDGYRAMFMSSSAAQVAAIRGERAHIQFRGFSPAERDQLVQALGNKITVQESPWDCSELRLDAPREEAVRRQAGPPGPLARARPLRGLEDAVQDHASSRTWAASRCPGTPYATPPAELEKLAGYGRDINANRAEAKRLLREAGVPDGFSFTFKNRGIPHPYEPIGHLARRPVAADRPQRQAWR